MRVLICFLGFLLALATGFVPVLVLGIVWGILEITKTTWVKLFEPRTDIHLHATQIVNQYWNEGKDKPEVVVSETPRLEQHDVF